MNYLKPCRNCGSLERYKNGACKPCALAKQLVRNEKRRLEVHKELEKRQKRNKKSKEIAKKNNESHYVSETPCSHCKGVIRYVCNGACIGCTKSRVDDWNPDVSVNRRF